jgi:hypothetical protein
MGFKPSKADSNLWIRDKGEYYELIACYVDDLLIWSKDIKPILDKIKENFDLKNVGQPEYYLGGNIEYMNKHWTREGINMGFSGRTYIENLTPKFEKLFNMIFKTVKTPMATEYHPEVDDSPFLSNEDAAKFRSIIGSLNWLITLGRFDVYYATNVLSRFSMQPREGHLAAAIRILTYVKTFPKGRIVIDTSYPSWNLDTDNEGERWKEFYPDAIEELPHNMPEPRGKPVRITAYLDADHAHDLVTRRSVTGVIMFINNTPIRFKCIRQKTVETSTYGSELVAARLVTEMVIAMRYEL